MAAELAGRLYIPRRGHRDGWPIAEIALGVALFYAALVALNLYGTITLSAGVTIVIGIRLFVPLLIFRYWLLGGVLALLVDAFDVVITDLLGMGGWGDHYAELDKALDSYYLAIELLVALTWRNHWARVSCLILFAYRTVGVVLFEVTGERLLLFLFPNLFEHWWLYCVVIMKWFPRLSPAGWRSLLLPMALLLVPKMGQEWLLHYAEATPWRWMKETFLDPLGLRP